MEQLNQDANQAGRSTGMVDRARHTAAAQLTTQKTRAAEALDSVAAALRQSSQPLRDNNQVTLARRAPALPSSEAPGYTPGARHPGGL